MQHFVLIDTNWADLTAVSERLQIFLKTRRERLESALYLRLKKRERLSFEKKLEIFEFFSFRKCRIVPKNVKGLD